MSIRTQQIILDREFSACLESARFPDFPSGCDQKPAAEPGESERDRPQIPASGPTAYQSKRGADGESVAPQGGATTRIHA